MLWVDAKRLILRGPLLQGFQDLGFRALVYPETPKSRDGGICLASYLASHYNVRYLLLSAGLFWSFWVATSRAAQIHALDGRFRYEGEGRIGFVVRV